MANQEHTRDDGGVPALRPAYLDHPGLKAYAEARRHIEATPLDDPHYDRAVATRVTAADDAANDLYATPAKSVDDVIAKLVAVIADFNGGKIEPDDPNFLQAVYDDLPPTGDGMDAAPVLAGIVRELVTLTTAPPSAAWEAARQRVVETRAVCAALEAEQVADDGSNTAHTKAMDARVEAAVDEWYDALSALDATPAPGLDALAFKLRQSLALTNSSIAEEFDDPAEFAESYWEAAQRNGQIGFIVYQDILRLIEPASPVIGVGPWRAVDFIEEYRKAGGDLRWVMAPDDCGLLNTYPDGHAGHPLARELAESPWKRAAVEARLQWEAEKSAVKVSD